MNAHEQNQDYGVRLHELLWANHRAAKAEAEAARLALLVQVLRLDLAETQRQRDMARDTAANFEAELWQERGRA